MGTRAASQQFRKSSPALDLAIVFALTLLNALLIWPFLLTAYSAETWNNDFIYIASARVFRDHPWTWNPLQYGGFPLQYMYPPLFLFFVAAMPAATLGSGFHLASGFAYIAAPVCFYLMVRTLLTSRSLAAFAALAYSVFPSLVSLLPELRGLVQPYHNAPWPFVALMGYAEAAHIAALSLTLLAVAAVWKSWWRAAAVCTAAVFLLNWPGAIGLLISLACLSLSLWRDRGFEICRRSFCAVSVGFGLAAVWNSPGLLSATTLLDRSVLQQEQRAAPWQAGTWLLLIGIGLLLLAIVLRRNIAPPLRFALLWSGSLSALVLPFLLFQNYLLPLPHRYVLEMNAALWFVVAAMLATLRSPVRAIALAILLCVGIFGGGAGLIRHAWSVQPHSVDERDLLAHRIASWLSEHDAASRVFTSGELDGSLHIWSDTPEVGGGRQGIATPLILAVQRQIAMDCRDRGSQPSEAEMWLRALAVKYMVVHDSVSSEHFHWFTGLDRFEHYPIAWDNRQGDRIYQLPFDNSPALIVDLSKLSSVPQLNSVSDRGFLTAYTEWVGRSRPASLRWTADDAAEIQAELAPDEGVLLRINYMPGWRSSQGAIEPDPIGFVLLRGAGNVHSIKLHYVSPWDVWLGRCIAGVALLFLAVGVTRVRLAPLILLLPLIAAYAYLLSTAPRSIAAVADAFQRLRPPLISASGIVDGVSGNQPPLKRGAVISIYGTDLGSASDQVQILIDGHPARILYRSANQVNCELPRDIGPSATLSMEVNGCHGNAFTVSTFE